MIEDSVKCTSVDVSAQTDDDPVTNYIPGSASTNTHLHGIFVRLSISSSDDWDDDRTISFLDNKSGDTLLKIFLPKRDTQALNPGFNLKIPCNGIRFPSGIKVDTTRKHLEFLGVFHS